MYNLRRLFYFMIMKIDLNYLKYQIKAFIFDDFLQKEASLILNSDEPETYCREYIKELKVNQEHEAQLRLKFRQMIDRAYSKRIPLGQDLFECKDYEEAYLRRQQYLSTLSYKQSIFAYFNKFVILIILIALVVVMVF